MVLDMAQTILKQRWLGGLAGLALLSGLALGPISAQAEKKDEVVEQIELGLEAYEAGDFSEAKLFFETAAQLIDQKKAEQLPSLLPEAPKGWRIVENEDEASASGAMFGGGITATRTYISEDGEKDVTVEIVGDSPIMSQMNAILMNPQVMGAMGDLKMIDRRRALLTKDGELRMLVDNRFVLNITGTGSEDDKVAFAKAIDFDGLKEFQ